MPAVVARASPSMNAHLVECGCGGGWDERSARRELGNIVARVRAGVWTRDTPHPRVAAQAAAAARPIPTFHEYASYWLQARTDGVLGDKPIEENTRRDYLWRLRGHLLPFFAPRRLDEIDPELCLAFKAHKVREAADLRTAITAGADLRDRRGQANRPARTVVDPQADRHACRHPRRRHRGRSHRPQPCARQAHARARAQASADLPRTRRAARAHRRCVRRRTPPRCQPRSSAQVAKRLPRSRSCSAAG